MALEFEKQKKFSIGKLILIVVVVAVIAGIVWWFFLKPKPVVPAFIPSNLNQS